MDEPMGDENSQPMGAIAYEFAARGASVACGLQNAKLYCDWVEPTTTIAEIKTQVSEKLRISVDAQKLLFLGRTLSDEQTVQSYPSLKDGSKLNLIVKKPEGLYDVAYKTFKQSGMSDAEASAKAKKFVQVIEEKFKLYSWDDIERLSEDCLRYEYVPKEKQSVL